MRAMRLERIGQPLVYREFADPEPSPLKVLIRVEACAVCRTDLHVIDGELPALKSPVTPGHEIVGVIDRVGAGVNGLVPGQRVGVGWLGCACHVCDYCTGGLENLCDRPVFTGYSVDGGFASHAVADAEYVYPLPHEPRASDLAPLMCAGLIGWRSLSRAGSGKVLGLFGFGAAAHIVIQLARWQGWRVFVFTRKDDCEAAAFARELGAEWVGASGQSPPALMDAAIIFAPAGELVPLALRQVRRGGRVICGGIHMSDIPSFPYRDLWGERQIISIANLTRQDARDFLALAPGTGIRVRTSLYALEDANRALDDLRQGRVQGAAVLVP